MRSSARLLGSMAGLFLSTGLATAADGFCHLHDHTPTPPIVARLRTAHDAGHPWSLRNHTAPSDNGHYDGYIIGGGTGAHGDGPCRHEGTWGWDYTGVASRVRLNWSHGRRYQGGSGTYSTEGPHPIERLKERIHGD